MCVQYDSLETTSNVITGIFAMATKTGEAPAITSVSSFCAAVLITSWVNF